MKGGIPTQEQLTRALIKISSIHEPIKEPMHSDLLRDEMKLQDVINDKWYQSIDGEKKAFNIVKSGMSSIDYKSLLSAHDIKLSDSRLASLKAKAALSMYDDLIREIRHA